MKLGNYVWNTPVFMAPMAGITDKAFREIIHSLGGKYVVTEMISDKALLYNNSKTLKMLDMRGEEEPRIVQLFGSEPEKMAEAARIIEEKGANVIDINMGCPTPKIVKNGEGAALLRDLSLATDIARSVVKAVKIPVTVKLRVGWSLEEITAPQLAQSLENVGIQMLTVHGRTREQFYSGKADWTWIKKIKDLVQVPVIGNGDIFFPEDAREMILQTGCDGVMIARGALGNPWLIFETQYFLETGVLIPKPDSLEKKKIILKHLHKLVDTKGEHIGINEMRKHVVWYVKGIRNAARFRDEIMQLNELNELEIIINRIFD
ncbi:MAG: tRNA dihydrouridine synthase DusB [Eubacteriales bacterium]